MDSHSQKGQFLIEFLFILLALGTLTGVIYQLTRVSYKKMTQYQFAEEKNYEPKNVFQKN